MEIGEIPSRGARKLWEPSVFYLPADRGIAKSFYKRGDQYDQKDAHIVTDLSSDAHGKPYKHGKHPDMPVRKGFAAKIHVKL